MNCSPLSDASRCALLDVDLSQTGIPDMGIRLYVASVIIAILVASPAALVANPMAAPGPAATARKRQATPSPSATMSNRQATPSPTVIVSNRPTTSSPATIVPNPLHIDIDGQWWDSTLFGALLGVVVGAALTAGTEAMRRRSDRSRARAASSSAARMARFADDLADAKRAAETTARAAATVAIVVELAQNSTVISPQSVRALTLNSNGITDQQLATDVDLLAARLAAYSGNDAATTPGGTLHDNLVALARQIQPRLQDERDARRAAADALATTGRQEALQEAATLGRI